MNGEFWLDKIRKLHQNKPQKILRIMNVCGGHERTLSTSGIRSLMPDSIRLIPGPGCPVCVCPEEAINFAIQLSKLNQVILASFGDMLRVPANNGKKHTNTLLQSRAQGNNVVAVASPINVIKLAKLYPKKIIVFFVAGFETTLAPIVSMLEQGLPDNLKLHIIARKTWPIVKHLLSSPNNNLDALIAPGHVASVMGSTEWEFVVNQFKLPCAIAGFTENSMLTAIYSTCRQARENKRFLDNCYPAVVNSEGNQTAKFLIHKYFLVNKVKWRGIGDIDASGFELREAYNEINAAIYFNDLLKTSTNNKQLKSEMPPGCDCDRVVLGQILPNQCRLFRKNCTPSQPIGPCMVSDEGACHIWWNTGSFKPQDSINTHEKRS